MSKKTARKRLQGAIKAAGGLAAAARALSSPLEPVSPQRLNYWRRAGSYPPRFEPQIEGLLAQAPAEGAQA